MNLLFRVVSVHFSVKIVKREKVCSGLMVMM